MTSAIEALRAERARYQVELDRIDRALSALGVGAETDSLRAGILGLLQNGPLTSREMIAALKCKENSLYVRVSRLRKDGLVVKEGKRYALP